MDGARRAGDGDPSGPPRPDGHRQYLPPSRSAGEDGNYGGYHQRWPADSWIGSRMVRARASRVWHPVPYGGRKVASARRGAPDDQVTLDTGEREFRRQTFQTGKCELQSQANPKTASPNINRRQRREGRAGYSRAARANVELARYA